MFLCIRILTKLGFVFPFWIRGWSSSSQLNIPFAFWFYVFDKFSTMWIWGCSFGLGFGTMIVLVFQFQLDFYFYMNYICAFYNLSWYMDWFSGLRFRIPIGFYVKIWGVDICGFRNLSLYMDWSSGLRFRIPIGFKLKSGVCQSLFFEYVGWSSSLGFGPSLD